jgi:hypothetical protein
MLAFATPGFAQTPNARAQVLAGEFSKFKNETRTKKGVSHTKYKEVVSEAWVAPVSAYAGRYLSDDAIYLEIEIDADGAARGRGRDDVEFQLRDLKIASGLITGAKAYANGRSETFEAVLLRRSARSSANESFAVRYGIGMLPDLSNSGVGELRVFAEKQ